MQIMRSIMEPATQKNASRTQPCSTLLVSKCHWPFGGLGEGSQQHPLNSVGARGVPRMKLFFEDANPPTQKISPPKAAEKYSRANAADENNPEPRQEPAGSEGADACRWITFSSLPLAKFFPLCIDLITLTKRRGARHAQQSPRFISQIILYVLRSLSAAILADQHDVLAAIGRLNIIDPH